MANPILSDGSIRTKFHYAYNEFPYFWSGTGNNFFSTIAYNVTSAAPDDSIVKITNLSVSILPHKTNQGYNDHGGYAKVTVGLFSSQDSTTPLFHLVKDMVLYPGQNIVLVDREDSIYLSEGNVMKAYAIHADGTQISSTTVASSHYYPHFTFMGEEYSVL